MFPTNLIFHNKIDNDIMFLFRVFKSTNSTGLRSWNFHEWAKTFYCFSVSFARRFDGNFMTATKCAVINQDNVLFDEKSLYSCYKHQNITASCLNNQKQPTTTAEVSKPQTRCFQTRNDTFMVWAHFQNRFFV